MAEVTDLRAEVCVLREAVNDFRMELEYLNRNGIRLVQPESGTTAIVQLKGIEQRLKEAAAAPREKPRTESEARDMSRQSTIDDGKLF